MAEEWVETAVKELAEDEDLAADAATIKDYAPGDGVYVEFGNRSNAYMGGQRDYMVFEDYDDAERAAVSHVEESFDDVWAGGFPDWAEHFVEKDEVAIYQYASEAANSWAYHDIEDDRILEEAGLQDDFDELQEKIDDLQDEFDAADTEIWSLEDIEEPNAQEQRELERLRDRNDDIEGSTYHSGGSKGLIRELEVEQERLKDGARDKVYEKHLEYLVEEMDDIVQYLKDHFGYGFKEIVDSGFVRLDRDAMAQYVVDNDGVAMQFANYDHNQIDLDSGAVAFRTN